MKSKTLIVGGIVVVAIASLVLVATVPSLGFVAEMLGLRGGQIESAVTPTFTDGDVAVTPTGAAKKGGCLPSEAFPESLALGDTTEMKLHFSRNDCRISITHVEIKTSDSYTRTITFDPPLYAGAIMDYEQLPHTSKSSGSFTGQAEIGRGDINLRLEQKGTYRANTWVKIAEPLGSEMRQWASDAKASSEYGSDDWSAKQATGKPNISRSADLPTAWAPKNSEGTIEWLELTYPKQIYPTGVHIRETFNPGFVTQVEAFDSTTGDWRTLWRGKDTTLDSPATFSPPMSDIGMKTNRIRITIDTNVPGWNEVDAVELVGRDTPTGWIVWSHGDWVEEGTAKLCDSRGCDDTPWENQPPHRWYWAFNTLTGKVGITPDQVR